MELEELISKVDIVDYIGQFVELNEKGGEFWGISPFTFPPERTPSFSVRREKQSFYDFSSGVGGSVLTFIKRYHGLSTYEAIEILKGIVGCDDTVSVVKLDATRVCKSFVTKPEQAREMPTVLDEDYMKLYEDRPEKYEIWRQEGITDESMKRFGVKYDAFSNRIVYPIRNLKGELVNVGGRTLDLNYKEKGYPKYNYMKHWGKGGMDVVYGLYENLEAVKAKKEIILFEGMKSVLKADGWGIKNTGSILTSHLNASQMRTLLSLGVDVVFALDKEVDIRKDINIKKLRNYTVVSTIRDTEDLIGLKDSPADRGREVFERLYEKRIRFR